MNSMFDVFIFLWVFDLMVLNTRITTLYFFSSQMDNEEIFDAFSASGSAGIKFRVGMDKQEEIKQENFDG